MVAPSINMVAPLVMFAPLVMVVQPMNQSYMILHIPPENLVACALEYVVAPAKYGYTTLNLVWDFIYGCVMVASASPGCTPSHNMVAPLAPH
jgi:hypothetical protein